MIGDEPTDEEGKVEYDTDEYKEQRTEPSGSILHLRRKSLLERPQLNPYRKGAGSACGTGTDLHERIPRPRSVGHYGLLDLIMQYAVCWTRPREAVLCPAEGGRRPPAGRP
jgi:hypothetical protein